MAISDFEKLAEAQRETVRALGLLTEELRRERFQSDLPQTPEDLRLEEAGGGSGTRLDTAAGQAAGERVDLERVLEGTARLVSELGRVTSANTEALTRLAAELGGLPGLLSGILGGVKGGGVVEGVLKSGLGIASLGIKIAGLFRDREPEPAPLIPFIQSPRLELEAANASNLAGGLSPAVRGQQGEIRSVEQQKTMILQPQVTVNVSAMDSRSFLDRSEDIARAVREAMLHMHPVNDLISEL